MQIINEKCQFPSHFSRYISILASLASNVAIYFILTGSANMMRPPLALALQLLMYVCKLVSYQIKISLNHSYH